MYIVIVDFEIHPEFLEAFRQVMLHQAENSLIKEPGCRQFDVCVSQDDPNHVFLYEVYDDQPTFEKHIQTNHFKEFDCRSKSFYKSKSARMLTRIWYKPEQ